MRAKFSFYGLKILLYYHVTYSKSYNCEVNPEGSLLSILGHSHLSPRSSPSSDCYHSRSVQPACKPHGIGIIQ